MSKYNYFDDEIEEENEKRTNKKRTKVKIDLSPVINKLKKIEATAVEEAEEDVEVIDKFPLLRHEVIKGLWIFGIIILIIIIAVSFSVSLGNKNKKAERFDKDAGNVCINYIKNTAPLNGKRLTRQNTAKTRQSLQAFAMQGKWTLTATNLTS